MDNFLHRLASMAAALMAVLACSSKNMVIEPVLSELDRTIDSREVYESEKRGRISMLERRLREAGTTEERLQAISGLYAQYKDYQYDSAYVYACRMADFPQDRPADRARAQIALLHCYKSVGFFNEATAIIEEFDPAGVPAEIRAEFWMLCAQTWQNLSSYVGGTLPLARKYDAERMACYDNVLECADRNSYLFGYARLEKMLHERYSDSLAIKGREAFIETTLMDDHEKAVQYSILAEAYNALEKYDEAVYYRAFSAILDIRTCTHETTSAKVLAGHMHARGDIGRAYRYIQQAQYDAEFYDSPLRKAEISSMLPAIENSRYNWLYNQRALLFAILAIIAVLLGLTIVLLLVLKSRNRALAGAHSALAEKTVQLEESNGSLVQANARLREANEIKDQYIIQSLYGNTAFVNEVSEAIGDAAREITLRRPDDARSTLYHIGIKKERARIAASFDTAFLRLFPNFLDEFNALFPESARIGLEDDGTLPTDVRIFALMRLGFDNAAEVAEYLNISVNTVYVYKARLKARSPLDKEEFDRRILAIPKP